MKIIKCLAIILFSLFISSCVNDKVPSTAEVVPAAEKKPVQKVVPPPASTPAIESNSKPTTTPTRPTENMKITLPGKNKPANVTKETPPPSPTAQQKTQYTEEEVRAIARQRDAQKEEPKRSKPTPKKSTETVDKNPLPNSCDLVSAEFVSQTLGSVAARDIYVKDGSGKNPKNARSCFFKWEEASNVNAGVLLQIQRNPLPDEFPDWASYFIRAKRDQGDKMPDGSGTYRYKDFPGMGIAGAYNYDLARYTWRVKSGHVFMVAFNLQSSEAEQLIWAEKIGKEAMRSFINLKN